MNFYRWSEFANYINTTVIIIKIDIDIDIDIDMFIQWQHITSKFHIKICLQILHITEGRCREGKPLLSFTPPNKLISHFNHGKRGLKAEIK